MQGISGSTVKKFERSLGNGILNRMLPDPGKKTSLRGVNRPLSEKFLDC